MRDCQDGRFCLLTGGWKTEDDRAELPPSGVVNLNGRGLCVWPIDAGTQDALPEFPPECPPEGC